MKRSNLKFMYVFFVFAIVVSVFHLQVLALDIPNEPRIKSLDAYKTKNGNEPSKFKIYLEGYNNDFLKVQQSGNRFRTKVYIYEEDSVILQPEIKEYKPEIEVTTTQTIDLGKKYYAQVEFISYNPKTYKIEDSKKSEKSEFNFAAEIKADGKNSSGGIKAPDISKVYIKAPSILEGSFRNEGEKAKVSIKFSDYNQIYSELKNNSNFLGEIVVLERQLNAVKVLGVVEFNDYSVYRDFMIDSPITSNNEYVVIARFASDVGTSRTYGLTSNEYILRERLNTQKYEQKKTPKYISPASKEYLFPNDEHMIEPERNINRGEVALAFYALLDERTKADNFVRHHLFADSIPAKYTEAISTIAKMRVINGYEDGSFRPNNPITRAEFITIAMKFFDDVNAPNVEFNDIAADFWAKQNINKAVSLGIINGYADGSFKPNNPITRAEVAKIVNRITGRVGKETEYKNKYIDNAPSKWYYEEIKAAN